jgi:hypothetical protein
MKVTSYIKSRKYFILGCFFILAVIIINHFPKGYAAVDGDVAQFIPSRDNLSKILFAWNGGTVIYYSFFYLLEKVGIPLHAQLSFYLAIFLFGSYISFYLFSGLISSIQNKYRVLLSLAYAFNFFTLYCSQSVFGYTSYYVIYIFIPVLIGSFLIFIKTGSRAVFSAFILAAFFSSMGFSNPAYAFGLGILFGISILAFLASGEITFSKKTLARVAVLILASFLISAFWILPLLSQAKAGVEGLESSNSLKLNWWIYQGSNAMEHTLGMIHADYRDFPQTSPYGFKFIFVLLSFIPMGLVLFFLTRRNISNKKKVLAFLLILIVFIALTIRTGVPFEKLNYYVYNFWGFSVLRAYEKTAIFVPFLMLATLLLLVEKARINKKIILLPCLIIVSAMPFFTGDLHKGAKSKFLSKIPNEYYAIQNTINSDKENVHLGMLPYNEGSGFGWSSYPKWDMQGVDITLSLYNKKGINPNMPYLGNWMAAKDFSYSPEKNQEWILKLLGIMNVKYIIYHKDVSNDDRILSEHKIKYLEEKGDILALNDNSYFTLYELRKDYTFPYISWQKEDIIISGNPESISENFEKIKKAEEIARFRESGLGRYSIESSSAFYKAIILAEKYDPNWKAYAIDKLGRETEIKDHFLARGYANGWKIPQNSDIKQIVIEYYPIRLMWLGMAISLATALVLVLYLAYPIVPGLFRRMNVWKK